MRRPHVQTRIRDEQGSSLVEMIIAIGLVSMLMAGAYTVLFQSQAIFEKQISTQGLRQESRVAINQMVSELRLTGYAMGTVTDALPAGAATSISIVADVDDGAADGSCDATYENATGGGAERVNYTVQSGQLRRTVDCWNGSAWTASATDEVWAADLQGEQVVFRYFDGSGVELVPATTLSAAQRAQVRSVRVALTLQDLGTTQITGEAHSHFELETLIKLRNLAS